MMKGGLKVMTFYDNDLPRPTRISREGMLVGNFTKLPLKETNMGMDQAFFDP